MPSDVAGKVKEINVKAGDKVKPGQAVLIARQRRRVRQVPRVRRVRRAPKAEAKRRQPKQAPAAAADAPRQPRPAEAARCTRRPQPASGRERRSPTSRRRVRSAAAPARRRRRPRRRTSTAAPAAPSVRRLAREIGVDVSQVTGTGPGGRITQDDVKEFAKRVMNSLGGNGQAAAASGAARAGGVGPALPDFAKWGEVERKAMTGIRRKTAEHLSHAWNAIPHVTQFDKADITGARAGAQEVSRPKSRRPAATSP